MDQWDDLFLTGVFAPRVQLLRGLTLEQAGTRPPGAVHSIYQELWHATTALQISLEHGRVALESWELGDRFPKFAAPANSAEWQDLVDRFVGYSERGVRMAADAEWLESPEPVYESTWRDALEFLAVHTAYHMGKIVLLRQLLGAWPPRDD